MGPAGENDRAIEIRGFPLTQGIKKRSVTIAGHGTSVSLESEFWEALKAIAAKRHTSLGKLITEIDAARTGSDPAGLSSALRVFVLRDAQGQTPSQ